jgi:hypothetical protein
MAFPFYQRAAAGTYDGPLISAIKEKLNARGLFFRGRRPGILSRPVWLTAAATAHSGGAIGPRPPHKVEAFITREAPGPAPPWSPVARKYRRFFRGAYPVAVEPMPVQIVHGEAAPDLSGCPVNDDLSGLLDKLTGKGDQILDLYFGYKSRKATEEIKIEEMRRAVEAARYETQRAGAASSILPGGISPGTGIALGAATILFLFMIPTRRNAPRRRRHRR